MVGYILCKDEIRVRFPMGPCELKITKHKMKEIYSKLRNRIIEYKEIGLALLVAGTTASIGAITNSETAIHVGMNISYITGLYALSPQTFEF